MPQHISVRVPWHDHGWNGTVCKDPQGNNACLRLKNIAGSRDDKAEMAICGQCMAEHVDSVCCIGEGGAFMSPVPISRTTIHPYKTYRYPTHQHFLPQRSPILPIVFQHVHSHGLCAKTSKVRKHSTISITGKIVNPF